MSAHCHHCEQADHAAAGHRLERAGYRRALWLALLVNAAMFGVEVAAGASSRSASLLADAIDFFGDAANYGLTLAVLSLGFAWRARAAALKAGSMLVFGLAVLGKSLWTMSHGGTPEPVTMGIVGGLALAANLGVAALLYAFRRGDANMQGVWLCTRNDAIGNVAVMLAALGVFGTGTAWPDLAVALAMAALAIGSGWTVLRAALRELARGAPA